jgi:hypothetical protein
MRVAIGQPPDGRLANRGLPPEGHIVMTPQWPPNYSPFSVCLIISLASFEFCPKTKLFQMIEKR